MAAKGQVNWEATGPETPLSELTVGDLIDAIGWGIAHLKAAEKGEATGFAFDGVKPRLPLVRQGQVGVMGWKEDQLWGSWRSNWWGVSTARR